MMKKIIVSTFIFALLFTVSNEAKAQNYNTALGLRFGGTSGVTFDKGHFEGILGFWGNGFSVTALHVNYATAFETPELNWFYGYGGHVAFFNNGNPGNNYGRGDRRYDDSTVGFGVDGIIGLEFKPNEIPFAFSFGLKPFLEIDTNGNFYGAPDPAIGIKYIIN
ncbi:hypothetical protein [Roseivirga echinicomitans]|uniref:Outer membrane protein beta-barrel domain-containing protein n=1 Tax=Roseivirga echinicomitans TaxID=296218 RepID=A0A150XXE0_9BACT|nr:hypothetical protein [Roseivirga echinicomitans]KYG83421.1 hypothetical protein AWN68_01045 [Roseivirga echinicomitans]